MHELVFETTDVTHTRFSTSPLDHVLLGAVAPGHAHFIGTAARRARWWRQARAAVPHKARPLLQLVNASRVTVPDFLTVDVTTPTRTLTDELDALTAVTDTQLRADLAHFPDDNPPRIVAQLRDQGQQGLQRLADAAWAFHRACLADDWSDIQTALNADIAHRARALTEHGLATALNSLHDRLTFHDNILRYSDAPGCVPTPDRTDHLGGRGLQIRPLFFLEHGLGFRHQPGQPTVLLHPAGRAIAAARAQTATKRGADPLAAVLGASRAAALRAIGQQARTTTDLATVLGVAPPAASVRTNALRAAGLITTTRHGQHVLHSLTPLGHQLLHATG